MATITELNDKVDQLQVTVDRFQEVAATSSASLKQVIADLQAKLEGSVSPEDLQTISDKISNVITDLESTPVE